MTNMELKTARLFVTNRSYLSIAFVQQILRNTLALVSHSCRFLSFVHNSQLPSCFYKRVKYTFSYSDVI